MKEDKMGVTFGTRGWKEKYVQDCVRKPEGNRPLGRPRRRWQSNMKMFHQET
jgi:hypothetical protein